MSHALDSFADGARPTIVVDAGKGTTATIIGAEIVTHRVCTIPTKFAETPTHRYRATVLAAMEPANG